MDQSQTKLKSEDVKYQISNKNALASKVDK
jgi:hypothetical protein